MLSLIITKFIIPTNNIINNIIIFDRLDIPFEKLLYRFKILLFLSLTIES